MLLPQYWFAGGYLIDWIITYESLYDSSRKNNERKPVRILQEKNNVRKFIWIFKEKKRTEICTDSSRKNNVQKSVRILFC